MGTTQTMQILSGTLNIDKLRYGTAKHISISQL